MYVTDIDIFGEILFYFFNLNKIIITSSIMSKHKYLTLKIDSKNKEFIIDKMIIYGGKNLQCYN